MPPATSTTRVASGRARSNSWLAIITVAPEAAACTTMPSSVGAAGGIERGVRLVEQPQLGAAGDQAGERGAPLLTGREPSHGQLGEAAGEAEEAERGVDLGARRADVPWPRT